MTGARERLRYRPVAAPGGTVWTALPVLYLWQDGVWWPAQALAAQGGIGMPGYPAAA
jgi:hypothetical protein